MLYDLSLHMGYSYDVPASGARHVMRLMPLSLPNRQRLVAGSITISPTPDEQSHFVDFFHHPTTSFMLNPPGVPRTQRAASSAPRANAVRSRAVCVTVIVSDGASNPSV